MNIADVEKAANDPQAIRIIAMRIAKFMFCLWLAEQTGVPITLNGIWHGVAGEKPFADLDGLHKIVFAEGKQKNAN